VQLEDVIPTKPCNIGQVFEYL